VYYFDCQTVKKEWGRHATRQTTKDPENDNNNKKKKLGEQRKRRIGRH
jgi:hypothetical protein